MIYKPWPYQEFGEAHIIRNPSCGLFFDMGLGKTVITLSATNKLMFDYCEVYKVLVIAPKRVAQDVWTTEALKWDHLKHLRISKVLGDRHERKNALKRDADIYVINRENVPWLVSLYKSAFPFDMVVIDELSSFKSAKAMRFKALRSVMPNVKRVIGLTGTPAPNGLIDLWSQLYLLDQGKRLGRTISDYRNRFFSPGKRNGAIVFNYTIKDEQAKEIHNRIGDICISLKSEDYLDLPGTIENIIPVSLGDEVMKQYYEFEKKQVLAMSDTENITVLNIASLKNKLLQFTGGALYKTVGSKEYFEVHTAKLDVLKEMVEDLNGAPVLVSYWFKSELERIKIALKAYKPVEFRTSADIAAWNEGKIKVLLIHSASAGHGLNLQYGGHNLIWYSQNYSLELNQQTDKRLDRPGQTKVVIINRLVAKDTIDEIVIKALEAKDKGQEVLLDAVKAIIAKYR